jgi:hypothetical protein
MNLDRSSEYCLFVVDFKPASTDSCVCYEDGLKVRNQR